MATHKGCWIGFLLVCSLFCGWNLDAKESADTLVTSPVEKLADGFRFIEGPVWHKDGYLLFTDIPANQILQWTPEKGISVWRKDSGSPNGLTFDLQGCLIACEHGNRRVSRTESDGSIHRITDRFQGKRLNSPNDCVVRSDGMIFFTDPPYGVRNEDKELSFHGVYCIKPGEQPVLLINDFERPNGLALSPDESILYIADSSQQKHIRKFQVKPDGTLGKGEVFAEMDAPDGIKVDSQGNVISTSTEGIIILSPDGKRLATIAVPEQPANCAFGGLDNKTLFITARTGLYSVSLKNPGISVWR